MPRRFISKGGTRGTVYRAAARERILDAAKLHEANRVHGAIYLAGYAIECHLKYAVCENEQSIYLEGWLESHSWERLLAQSGILSTLHRNKRVLALYQELAEAWTTSLRYDPENRVTPDELQLYQKLIALYQFFKDTVP